MTREGFDTSRYLKTASIQMVFRLWVPKPKNRGYLELDDNAIISSIGREGSVLKDNPESPIPLN